MPKSGDIIDNPVTGERYVVSKSSDDTRGESFEGDMHVAAHACGPPEHVHPNQEERFTVVSGALKVKIAGQERVATVGDVVVVPPGTPHRFWNDSDIEAVFRAHVHPALRLEEFLETAFALARDGKTNSQGRPNLLQAAVLLKEYSDEIHLASPPPAVQKALFGLLAPFARLLGFTAHYPRHGDRKPG